VSLPHIPCQLQAGSVLRRLTALMLVFSLSFSLAAGAFASTPRAASAQDNASELCKQFLERGIEAIGSEVLGVIFNEEIELEITHGSCVSLVQAGNFTALAVSICRTFDEEASWRRRTSRGATAIRR
jgi:hypothetical protein